MDIHSLFDRRNPQKSLGTIVAMTLIGFGAGFLTEGFIVHQQGYSRAGDVPAGVDMAPVWKAWQVLDEKFVPDAVASTTPLATSTQALNQDRVWGMIAGMAASLNDPYTFFLPPQQAQAFNDDMSGSFQGVGMEIEVKEQVLTVVSPLKGNPAEKAGIKTGDKILKINGIETKGMDVSTAVKNIRGPKDTQVTLQIYRTGWDAPREFKVTRDVINVPIVNTIARKDGVFVISVATFTSTAPDLFRNALREFILSGDKKLVLDLRGNPGGYLDAAVSMASWFIPGGSIIVTEDYHGHEPSVVHRSLGYNAFTKELKMAILVDKGSASASEILSDSLRYYKVAKMIGTNTYGKGVVQELVDITPETSLKVTVARWLGPDGTQIPHTGLVPDIEATTSDELIKAGKDPQMDAAVRYLLK